MEESNVNGCGSNSGPFKGFKPPYHLFFKASCDKHDACYNKGGTELDRWLCDVNFYNAMRYDVKRSCKVWYVRQYYLLWCKIYFLAVRLFGKKSFNFAS